MTSEAWWIFTWTRLVATTPAMPHHTACGTGLVVEIRMAAVTALVEWPLGNELVLG